MGLLNTVQGAERARGALSGGGVAALEGGEAGPGHGGGVERAGRGALEEG